MYRVYVKENGEYHLAEEFERKESVYSKIDEWLERGYEEVMVLNDFNYVMGKIRERGKVLKK